MVQEGQNIFDYCLQKYGTIDIIIDDLLNNNDLTFNSDLNSGQLLIINLNKGNEDVKNFVKINNFVINNGINIFNDEVVSTNNWILKTGFWDDAGVWIDTKLWID